MMMRTVLRSLADAAGRLKQFRHDRRGNVLLLFSLSVIPLTFATGMGIDYSLAMRLQTKLNAAADAAALASTTVPMLNKTMDQACNAAVAMFKLQSSGLAGLTLDTSDPTQFKVVVKEDYATQPSMTGTCGSASSSYIPLARTTTITYRGQSANTFGGLLGKQSLTVSGVATTRVAQAPYINIHLALDNSQSMGLAATQQDAINLFALTKAQNGANRGCTFGCHVIANADNGSNRVSNEVLAHNAGLTLREDVLKNATKDMITTASTNEGSNSFYQFAMYAFGASLSSASPSTKSGSNPSGLTSNLSLAQNDASAIDLGPNTGGGDGDTNLADMLAKLSPDTSNSSNLKIGVHGDGTTQGTARAFLFIITDGVFDTKGSCTSGHCTGPIDPSSCQVFKNNNVTIGVVYTTYLPIYNDPNNTNSGLYGDYKSLVQKFSNAPGLSSSDIAPRLQACASPGWYFEASDGAAIHAAMQKLFSQASQNPVITH